MSRANRVVTKGYGVALLAIFPSVAKAEVGGIFEGGYTLFDVSGSYAYGGKVGLSYQSDYGTHYLIGGAFYLEQEDIVPLFGPSIDVDSVGFSLSYRHGFSFFEDFEPYLEYGWTNISSSYDATDIFGNPEKLESDSSGDYLSAGIIYRLWEDLHLKFEVGYHGIFSDLTVNAPASDAFGNPQLLSEEIQLSGSIGISFKF